MVQLNQLWNRRQCTKFNGTAYIVQRAAEAIYSEEGKREVRDTIHYYMTNARIMREALTEVGLQVYGGVDAPYLWLKTPEGVGSWEFFEQLLTQIHVVSTPGVGLRNVLSKSRRQQSVRQSTLASTFSTKKRCLSIFRWKPTSSSAR